MFASAAVDSRPGCDARVRECALYAASGTEKTVKLLERSHWDETLLADLTRVMSDASICGLGQAAMNPVKSVLKHFRAEVETHVLQGHCPSGICFSAANRLPELPRVGIRP